MGRPPPQGQGPGTPDVEHLPVLVQEAVELLAPWREAGSGLFVDATVGLGGHAEALLAAGERRSGGIRLVGIDRDPDALARASRRLAPHGERVRLVAGNFHRLAEVLAGIGIGPGTGEAAPGACSPVSSRTWASPLSSSGRRSAVSASASKGRSTCEWVGARAGRVPPPRRS